MGNRDPFALFYDGHMQKFVCDFEKHPMRRMGTQQYVPNSSSIHGLRVSSSVTRLGDLLDFGQLFKVFGNN